MTAVKKPPARRPTAYQLAAAAFRTKIAAQREPDPRQIQPVDGRIHVTLSGAGISSDRLAELFGESEIDIPELRQAFKKSP